MLVYVQKVSLESCETTGDLYTYLMDHSIVATIKSITFSFISSMAQNLTKQSKQKTKHLSN